MTAPDTLPDMPVPPAPVPPPPPPPLTRMTERDMLDLLHKRYGFVSHNGGVPKPRYVKAEHVRAKSGFFDRGDPSARTADFVAVDTWASGKCAIHGVEVKVSRADWLRELKTPGKAAACMAWCSFWWLAVPDQVIVKDGELPPGWGLLAPQRWVGGWRLQQVIAAPFRDVHPIPPASMASLLYAAARTAAARGTA